MEEGKYIIQKAGDTTARTQAFAIEIVALPSSWLFKLQPFRGCV